MWNCPLLRSNTTGVTSGVGTAHSSEGTPQVLQVETKLISLQKYTTGANSGGGTDLSSEANRRVLPVEEELPTLLK